MARVEIDLRLLIVYLILCVIDRVLKSNALLLLRNLLLLL